MEIQIYSGRLMPEIAAADWDTHVHQWNSGVDIGDGRLRRHFCLCWVAGRYGVFDGRVCDATEYSIAGPDGRRIKHIPPPLDLPARIRKAAADKAAAED